MTGPENHGEGRAPGPLPSVFPAGRSASIVLAAYALAALSASAIHLARIRPPRDGPDDVAGRIEELRGLLRPGEIVGYLDDGEGGDAATATYYLTQYALAPVLVARGEDHARVLGRFLLPPPISRLRDLGLVLERDLGGGILLFRRRGP